jgi:hypothetical protein
VYLLYITVELVKPLSGELGMIPERTNWKRELRTFPVCNGTCRAWLGLQVAVVIPHSATSDNPALLHASYSLDYALRCNRNEILTIRPVSARGRRVTVLPSTSMFWPTLPSDNSL